MIIAVSGLLTDSHGGRRIAGAGKDEVGKILVQHGFISVAFADIMKRFLRELFDFTEGQLWGPSEERAKPDQRYPRTVASFDEGDAFEAGRLGLRDPGKIEPLTPRYALQRLGDWGRDCYPDIWADKALEIAKIILTQSCPQHCARYEPRRGLRFVPELQAGLVGETAVPEGVVIPDCRFRNEFRRVREEGGKILLVERHCTEFPSKLDDTHVSERDVLNLDRSEFDGVLSNDGDLAQLRATTERWLVENSLGRA